MKPPLPFSGLELRVALATILLSSHYFLEMYLTGGYFTIVILLYTYHGIVFLVPWHSSFIANNI